MIVVYLTFSRTSFIDYKKRTKTRTMKRYCPKSLKPHVIVVPKRIIF